MFRSTLLLLSIGLSADAQGADSEQHAKGPSVEKIQKAIAGLGSDRFADRESARKFLEQEAGAAAEPFLQQAARSPDGEVAASAAAILRKFEWGLYPDVPKSVRKLIEKFRDGQLKERLAAVNLLLKQKPIPAGTLCKLLPKEENPEHREGLYWFLHRHLLHTGELLDMLGRGEHDAVEALLELAMGVPSKLGYVDTDVRADYAVFIHLRGKVDETIKRYESQRSHGGDRGKQAAGILAYLYRTKGDWASARKAAAEAANDQLLQKILRLSGDWKRLAAAPVGDKDRPSARGRMAVLHRLAGNSKEFEATIDEICRDARKRMAVPQAPRVYRDLGAFDNVLDETNDDDIALLYLGRALSLNHRPNLAIKLFRTKDPARTFALLAAQMRYPEAFAVANEPRRPDADRSHRNQPHEIETERAQTLYLLGEKESAKHLFQQLVEELPRIEVGIDLDQLLGVIKAESRCPDLRGIAEKHAAQTAEFIDRAWPGKADYAHHEVFRPLFGPKASLARSWWSVSRRESPDEKPTVAMGRVRDVIEGRLDRKSLDYWAGRMLKLAAADVLASQLLQHDARGLGCRKLDLEDAYSAIAAAYEAVGDDARADGFLRLAADKARTGQGWIAHGNFQMARKHYRTAAESYAEAIRLPLDDRWATREAVLAVYLQARACFAAGDARQGQRLLEAAPYLSLSNEFVRAHVILNLDKQRWPEMARKETALLLNSGYSVDGFGFGARQAIRDNDFLKAAEFRDKSLIALLSNGEAFFADRRESIPFPDATRVYRARGLVAAGRIDDGIKEAMASLEVLPGNVDLASRLVPELERSGRKADARVIYDKVRPVYDNVLAQYPKSAFLHERLARLMANCRRDLDTALIHAARAVELEPKSADCLDALAEVHFRSGNRNKAIELMKRCIGMEPAKGYFQRQLARFEDQPFDSEPPAPDEDD